MEYKIALIPGDGIGKEVVPEGVRVLKALALKYNFEVMFTEFPFSCEFYLQHGKMMPADGLKQLEGFDAILLGAVGDVDVADHVSLWGLLIPIRREFQQYVNLRPVRLLPGISSPLANRTMQDIYFYIVRENNEGEYSQIGGRLYEGTDLEMVVQETVFTRRGVDRILRYAFELALSRPKKHLKNMHTSHQPMARLKDLPTDLPTAQPKNQPGTTPKPTAMSIVPAPPNILPSNHSSSRFSLYSSSPSNSTNVLIVTFLRLVSFKYSAFT